MDSLVIRARRDADALGQLYERHYDRLFCYCMRRLYVREIAEDVTATVFLQVARHMPTFAGTTEQDFPYWLYAIATNEINTLVRVAKRREPLLDTVRQERLAMEAMGTGDDRGLHRLDWPVLYEAILQLKPRHQAVVVLRYWEGLEHRAIAEVLGCQPVTVRVMLMRALGKLRKHLGAMAI